MRPRLTAAIGFPEPVRCGRITVARLDHQRRPDDQRARRMSRVTPSLGYAASVGRSRRRRRRPASRSRHNVDSPERRSELKSSPSRSASPSGAIGRIESDPRGIETLQSAVARHASGGAVPTGHTDDSVEPAVEVDHPSRTSCLMEPVDVLSGEQSDRRRAFPDRRTHDEPGWVGLGRNYAIRSGCEPSTGCGPQLAHERLVLDGLLAFPRAIHAR